MRLNSFTDFGLRALMRMASAPECPFSTGDLARELGLSRHHLTKIMQRLARGGIVETRRGAGGGAMLARAPQDIRLGEIVRLLEERTALVDCFRSGGSDCTLDGCCRLKGKLRMAAGAFLAELDRSTLADIALPVPAMAYRGGRAVGGGP